MLEKIENDAADLQASAGIFRQQAKNLKSKMWWKKLKMNLCIAAVVLTITGVNKCYWIVRERRMTINLARTPQLFMCYYTDFAAARSPQNTHLLHSFTLSPS